VTSWGWKVLMIRTTGRPCRGEGTLGDAPSLARGDAGKPWENGDEMPRNIWRFKGFMS